MRSETVIPQEFKLEPAYLMPQASNNFAVLPLRDQVPKLKSQ